MKRLKFRSAVPLERDLHMQIAAWLNTVLPRPWRWTTFPAGGGGRVRGAQLKRMGLAPGVPDILLFSPLGDWLGVEVKRAKGGVVSPAQEDWIAWAAGRSVVVRSVDELESFLKARGVLK